LAICICKTLLLHRPDDFIDFTLNCPLHILQQNVPMAAGKWEHTQNKKKPSELNQKLHKLSRGATRPM